MYARLIKKLEKSIIPTASIAVISNYCKKLNSLKHLVRTTVAELHN